MDPNLTAEPLSRLGRAALHYAREFGWRVFPLHSARAGACSCGSEKCPPKNAGKHPRTANGFKDAVTDVATIEAWWRRWPDANVGVATGRGLIVVDVDPLHGGEHGFDELRSNLGALPDTVEAITGSRGRHVYLSCDPEVEVRCSAGVLAEGIDVRGDGGYVVAPPSVSGIGTYGWELSSRPGEVELAPCPTAWLNLMLRPRPQLKVIEGGAGEAIPEGKRNDSLFRLACSFRTNKHLTPQALEAALLTVNETRCNPPLDPVEVRRIAEHVCEAYPAGKSAQYERPETETGEHPAGDADSDSVTLPLTDVGNAERILRRHGEDLRWLAARESFLVWDGTRWTRDETGEAVRRAIDTVRQIPREADEVDGKDERRAILSHAIRSESSGKIDSALKLLRAQPGVAVTVDQLDADPWALVCTNGTVNLRTGELRPHRREDLTMKSTGIRYDVDAEACAFEAFLDTVQPDPEIRSFLQRLLGYALTGVVREHVLPIHYGGGGNGKGTLTETVLRAVGDYGRQVPTELLLSRLGDPHPTERATLLGVRLATVAELPKGRGLNENLVKQLTGGDTIAARYMGQDFFEFRPTHKLWVSTNNRPALREAGNGIWRRVLLIPWSVTVDTPDTSLPDRLAAELPGVLRWLVQGCLAWQDRGLDAPRAVRAATDEYRAECDVIGQFIAERCSTEPLYPGAAVQENATALHKAYVEWCEASGYHYETVAAFGAALEQRGHGVVKKGVKFRQGLRLMTPAELRPVDGEEGES